jgi:hypothetical protein
MIHGKSQVEPFPEIVEREGVFGELEPSLNRKTVEFFADEFLFSDHIT